MKLPTVLFAAATLLLAVAPCGAADEQGRVTVQFVRVPATEDDRTALLQLGPDQTIKVDLPTNTLSDAYELDQSESWVLGKMVRDAEGKEAFETLGQAPATRSQRQVVVVIDKGEMNDGKLELIVMDLAPQSDAFQFVNASKYDISGELGIERFGIAPMEHALLKAEATESDEYQRRFCDVAFSFLKDKDYQKFFDAKWHLEDKTFALVIFHQEAVDDKLKMTVIREAVN